MRSQTAFFNSVAANWDTMCNHDMKKVEFILDLLKIEEGQQILDVGTGTGILIPSLVRRVGTKGKIVGVDLAEKMIEVARAKNTFNNVIFKCEDVLEHEPCGVGYDVVICYSMFPHFEDKEKAIIMLSKKLKANGQLIICHSESRQAINNMHQKANESVKEDHLPTAEKIKQYFVQAHLKVTEVLDTQEIFLVMGTK